MIPILVGAAVLGVALLSDNDDDTSMKNGQWIDDSTTRQMSEDQLPLSVRKKIK